MVFEDSSPEQREKMSLIWKSMNPQDKEHFINQSALILSIAGEHPGRQIVRLSVENMVDDGCANFADIGIYLEYLEESAYSSNAEAFAHACGEVEKYRFRHDLPGVPQKDIFSSS
jgi:hypothetical protein